MSEFRHIDVTRHGEFEIELWFEFVPSKLKFGDGVSRDFEEDACCLAIGVRPSFVWICVAAVGPASA